MSTLQSDTRTNASEIQKLHEAGWPVVRIANALHMSPQGVYYHLKKLGLKTKKQQEREEART